MIGEESFLNKGFSYLTLNKFTETQKDINAFIVDPEISNLKAIHIYEKAGFKKIGSYIPQKGYFVNLEHIITKKDLIY